MRVLVTGGAGFIGSHVWDLLWSQGHRSFILDNFSTGNKKNISKAQENGFLCLGDISDKADVDGIVGTLVPDAIIHLAAQAAISTSIEDPVRDLEINAKGTLNIIQAALKYGVKRFVFASTSAVYWDIGVAKINGTTEIDRLGPDTPYGISKLAAEQYVRTLFPESVILRFGNVYGPRQIPIGENQVITRMIKHLKYGEEFYIHGSGNQRRDFVYVQDVSQAVLLALTGECGTYNIATGESHSVNDIAKIIETYYGVKGYKWDHTDQEDPRKNVKLNVDLAERYLHWTPKVKLMTEGLLRTIGWWESL